MRVHDIREAQERLAELMRQDEREACANIADIAADAATEVFRRPGDVVLPRDLHLARELARYVAQQIRARGSSTEKKP